jgi:ferredoxin
MSTASSNQSSSTQLSSTQLSSTQLSSTGTASLHIDWTRCDGRGLCAELLPELLERDDWGYPRTRDGSRDVAVPRGLRGHAVDAVAACPVLALRLGGQS